MAREGLGSRMPTKAAQARSLGISRQSLYYLPRQERKDETLRDEILAICREHPTYGHKRIAMYFAHHLKRRVNKKRIRRVMNKYHLVPKVMRKRKYVKNPTEDRIDIIPNRVKNIRAIQPDVIWAGDFTETWFKNRWVYLATVIDLYTREVIAWQIGFHHTTQLILDVFEEASHKRLYMPMYFHSDQGSEYTSRACIAWLVKRDIEPSQSPKGNPWYNGTQESFYNTFKLEFVETGGVRHSQTVEDLIERIGKYLHYYNTQRIHSALKMPPKDFYNIRRWKKGRKKTKTKRVLIPRAEV